MGKSKGIVRRIQSFMDSPKGRTFTNYIYSWGAAIVILGTLFKLTHMEGANLMLFVGMGTEVIVFFFSAFERPYDVAEEEKREEEAEEALAHIPGQPVIIRADRETKYDDLVKTIDACRAGDVWNFSLATENAAEGAR